MKISTLLIFISAFSLSAESGYSQDKDISLKLSNVYTIENVISEIEKTTDYVFIYNEDVVPTLKKEAKVEMTDQSLDEILNQLIKGTDLGYSLSSKQVTLYKDESKKVYAQIVSSAPLVVQQPSGKTIAGRVTDTYGESLPGVTVIVKGTTKGTTTDVDGNFSLTDVPENATLQFSFVGMKMQEIPIGNQTRFDIVMEEEAIGLAEVVAIGYGTMRKSDITGAISSIKGDDIRLQAVGNPINALTGVAAGVQVLQTSGQPGTGSSVLIRGGNSLLGSNEPLYVVDGIPLVGDLGMLNTNDIESIEILKDASATAIYGSRAANGVVLVTTRSGTKGTPHVEYSGYFGYQKVSNTIDVLNAREFASIANERFINDGKTPPFTKSEIDNLGEGFNWQNAVLRTAPIQNHSLSLSGGNESTVYYFSGSYWNQDGIIINSGYKNRQLRARVQTHLRENWTFSFNSILSSRVNNNLHSTGTERGMGVLSAAVGAPPTVIPYDDDGNYNSVMIYPFSPEGLENPFALANERKEMNYNDGVNLNLSTNLDLFANLTLYSSLGIQINKGRTDSYRSSKLIASSTGDASIRYSEYSDILNENILTYKALIRENHDLTMMGGFTSQKNSNQYLLASSTGFLSDLLEHHSLQAGSNPGPPNSGISEWSLLSYLGRINYLYKSKYLFTASIRADGSSRFGIENRWGYFPSAAIAWRLSDENFLQRIEKLSNLMIRASWGVTGNTAISPYQSMSTLFSDRVVFDKNIHIGYAPGSAKPNPNLKWEETNQLNIGVDLGLFNNRLTVTADLYKKKTKDLLVNIPVVLSSGYSTQITNLGDMQNKGFEIALNARLTEGLIKWNIGANISINRNKVLKLPGNADIYGQSIGWVLPSMNLVREGEPVGVFYGFIEDGLTEDGIIKYKDLNNDGDITPLDRTIIGDPNPNFVFGVTSDLTYNNFGLSILINGVQGNDIINYNLSNIEDSFSYGINQSRRILGNYWTEENPNPKAKYPRISENTRFDASDRFVEDASYIQIKNIKLSYTLKRETIKFLEKMEFSFGIQNLATFTRYSFFSPIQNNLDTGINKGIDKWGYPESRMFMLGAILTL